MLERSISRIALYGLAVTSTALVACGEDGNSSCPEGFVCTPEPETCIDYSPDPGEQIKWSNFTSRGVVALGEPQHSVQDVAINSGDALVLEGKFAYGPVSKDLEGEPVIALMQTKPCEPWVRVGVATTDSDGRARVAVDASLVPESGTFPFEMIVRGDHTKAVGTVFILKRATPVAIFDIDGTLTTADAEAIEGIVDEVVESLPPWLPKVVASLEDEHLDKIREAALDEDARIRDGAVSLVEYYVSLGYQPVYITGRPYLLDKLTRAWLERHELPAGPLIMAPSLAAAQSSGVKDYKRDAIVGLERDLGVDVQVAYGNASTDVCAYAEAGITLDSTYIIGEHAGSACPGHDATQAVTDYVTHLEQIRAPAAQ